MMQFEYDDCGTLTEYIGNKIEYMGKDAIRMIQTVLTRSYEDEFELGKMRMNLSLEKDATIHQQL
jgi:hypothetical protein